MEGFSKRSQNLDEPSASATLGQSHLVFSHVEGRKRFQPRLASPNFSLQTFQGSRDNVGECRVNPDKNPGLIRKRAPKLVVNVAKAVAVKTNKPKKTLGVLVKQSQCFGKKKPESSRVMVHPKVTGVIHQRESAPTAAAANES